MRLLLRTDDGAGALVDLDVELTEDATVGELADHLAARIGRDAGTSIRVGAANGEQLARAGRVADVGPRSGATVRLVDGDAPPGDDPDTRPRSPVHLLPVDPAAPTRALPYGVSDVGGMRLVVDDRVELCATSLATGTVDGARVVGSRRLRDGELIVCGDVAATVRIGGPLTPPERRGPTTAHRPTPRVPVDPVPCIVDLPVPPGPVRVPGLPLLSAFVPLLMGLGLWAATRSAATAAFVLFSVVFVLAAGIEARRESRAEQRFRIAEFHADLDDVAEAVDRAHRDEQRRSVHDHPSTDDLLARSRGTRLWERTVADGALVVRVGSGRRTPATTCRAPDVGRRDLRVAAYRVASERQVLDLPCTVDLDDTGGLAVVGPDESTAAVARAVVATLATWVAPDELAIRVVAAPARELVWRWVQWLPHARSDQVARTLVVVDGADDAEVDDELRRAGAGARLLRLGVTRAGLPEGLATALELSDGPHPTARLHRGHDATTPPQVTPASLSAEDALGLARELAGRHVERSTVQLPGRAAPHRRDRSLPSHVALADLAVIAGDDHAPDPERIAARWARSDGGAHLDAPIGRAARGVWHLDLHDDGPHALVAGTTGSGKSELLRTMVTSMALHHRPQRLTFLLVDYKGGAAFGPLSELPHTVGLLTDLDPTLAQRALRSLRAEVRRRERVLSGLAVADLAAAIERHGTDGELVPPALVVVVDEFATLAQELPAFVDGLVDVAQRGRSLGVHLVLATQRPAGVVSDSIRAHTTWRRALRVSDEQDSVDVVGAPDAARLPRDVPGRALLRTGPGEPTGVQVASCSLPATIGPRVRSAELGTRPLDARPNDPTDELPRLVAALCTAAAGSALPAPRRPWVEPLPDRLELHTLPVANPRELVVGLVDRPDAQQLAPLVVDLARTGGGLVLGASGAGRSTALVTLVHAATRSGAWGDEPDVVVHGIDSGDGLSCLLGRPGVGDVVGVADHERVLRLLRSLHAEARVRLERPGTAGAGAMGRRVLVVDGYRTFDEVQSRVNRGEAIDLLERLARDGRRVGVHVVVSAGRRPEVPAALASTLGWQLALRSGHPDDAVLVGLDPASAGADVPPGRGHVGGELVQIAVPAATPPPGDTATAGSASSPHLVPRLPTRVLRSEIAHDPHTIDRHADDATLWSDLVLGLAADEVRPIAVDLRHDQFLVAGPPRSGRTTALASLASAVAGSARRHGHDARLVTVEVTRSGRDGVEVAALLDDAVGSARDGTPTLVALDGLAALADRS
ncbi:MAG: FtsK/SpoIIIE domain-containing protein, partial [Microthrixaceae bacterium]